MSAPRPIRLPPPTAAEKSEARTDALTLHLDQASKRYRAETGDDTWRFTLDAVIYLTDWLGLAQPELTKEFLLALSARPAAGTRAKMTLTDARVIKAYAALIVALRDRSAP